MGAAGRDFHNFKVFFKDNEDYEVVAFTATQIPNIDDRKYPSKLAGKLYPNGIPIYSESELTGLIKEHYVDEVVFSTSGSYGTDCNNWYFTLQHCWLSAHNNKTSARSLYLACLMHYVFMRNITI